MSYVRGTQREHKLYVDRGLLWFRIKLTLRAIRKRHWLAAWEILWMSNAHLHNFREIWKLWKQDMH